MIENPTTTPEMRTEINNVLFEHYKDWATTKAIKFKRFHKHKCYHIPYDEIISMALFGLYKGILKYPGNYTFVSYVDLHVKNALYTGMTKLSPMTTLTQSYLKKRKTIEENKKVHNVYLKPKHIGFNNFLMDNSIHNEIQSHKNKWIQEEDSLIYQMKIWEKIRELPPLQMKIMYYKYSSDFDILRSNGAIAEIMGCSTGKIRMHLIKAKTNLLPMLSTE